MKWVYNDGGRSNYYKGDAYDFVVRAIAIATNQDYKQVYDMVNEYIKREPYDEKYVSNARSGVSKEICSKLLKDMGYEWTSTMKFGHGCSVHLRKNEILNQIDVLNNSHDNLSKMSKLIQEEINGGSIDEFIRKFVGEIIVSKIKDDRYNIKLDIFLNLLGVEKSKTKGARHIDGPKDDEVLYMENVECNTTEIKRSIDHPNKYTYNVYVEAL